MKLAALILIIAASLTGCASLHPFARTDASGGSAGVEWTWREVGNEIRRVTIGRDGKEFIQ